MRIFNRSEGLNGRKIHIECVIIGGYKKEVYRGRKD